MIGHGAEESREDSIETSGDLETRLKHLGAVIRGRSFGKKA